MTTSVSNRGNNTSKVLPFPKHYLESNDGAGNTFKATAKPVLIATAVVGATTLIFSLILLIKQADLNAFLILCVASSSASQRA